MCRSSCSTTRSATVRLAMMRFCVAKNSRLIQNEPIGLATSSTSLPSGVVGCGSYSMVQVAW